MSDKYFEDDSARLDDDAKNLAAEMEARRKSESKIAFTELDAAKLVKPTDLRTVVGGKRKDFDKWLAHNFPVAHSKSNLSSEWLEYCFPELKQVSAWSSDAKHADKEDLIYSDPRLSAMWKLVKSCPGPEYELCVRSTDAFTSSNNSLCVWKKSSEIKSWDCPVYVISFDTGDWYVHKPLNNFFEFTFSVADLKSREYLKDAPNPVYGSDKLAFLKCKEQAISTAAKAMGLTVPQALLLWRSLGVAFPDNSVMSYDKEVKRQSDVNDTTQISLDDLLNSNQAKVDDGKGLSINSVAVPSFYPPVAYCNDDMYLSLLLKDEFYFCKALSKKQGTFLIDKDLQNPYYYTALFSHIDIPKDKFDGYSHLDFFNRKINKMIDVALGRKIKDTSDVDEIENSSSSDVSMKNL